MADADADANADADQLAAVAALFPPRSSRALAAVGGGTAAAAPAAAAAAGATALLEQPCRCPSHCAPLGRLRTQLPTPHRKWTASAGPRAAWLPSPRRRPLVVVVVVTAAAPPRVVGAPPSAAAPTSTRWQNVALRRGRERWGAPQRPWLSSSVMRCGSGSSVSVSAMNATPGSALAWAAAGLGTWCETAFEEKKKEED